MARQPDQVPRCSRDFSPTPAWCVVATSQVDKVPWSATAVQERVRLEAARRWGCRGTERGDCGGALAAFRTADVHFSMSGPLVRIAGLISTLAIFCCATGAGASAVFGVFWCAFPCKHVAKQSSVRLFGD